MTLKKKCSPSLTTRGVVGIPKYVFIVHHEVIKINSVFIESISANTEILSMAPRTGLEPVTSKLTASCSTIELPGNVIVL